MSSVRRKQSTSPDDWSSIRRDAVEQISADEVERLVDDAADHVRRAAAGRRAGIAWSGGKDSQVIREVCRRAGVHRGMLALTNAELEIPAFESFVADEHDVIELVRRQEWDLQWLADHPAMLFPDDATQAAKWFAGVQWRLQRQWCRSAAIDVLFMGRRALDGNFAGPHGDGSYRDKAGFWRACPLWKWTHEQVMATIGHLGLPLAPNYDWPRGFRVATGPWPKRRRLESEHATWAEVDAIDRGIIEHAATKIPAAADYLRSVAA